MKKVKDYVKNLLSSQLPEGLTFHNLDHTLKVHERAVGLAEQLEVAGEDREILEVAALFHDTGFTESYEGHEIQSAQIARRFLEKEQFPSQKIDRVVALILATHPEHQPTNILEEILRDADLYHLGIEEYPDYLARLREELATCRQQTYKDRAWLKLNNQFLKNHSYHTAVAQSVLNPVKEAHRQALKKQRKAIGKAATNKPSSILAGSKSAQMMFKATLRNNIDLTSIADNKANIMLSINALIISIAMPLLARELGAYPYLIWPTAVLLLTCVVSIIYATMATRPAKTSGITRLEDLRNGKTNLFFFGNFHRMSLSHYNEGIREVLSNDALLDDSIIQDLFFLGKTLGRKFNLLRICYLVFTVGITVTVLSFALSFFLWAGT